MAQEQNISKDLYDLLISRNWDVESTDTQGQPSQPADASVFTFDYVSESGKNYGTAVAVLTDDGDLQLFYGDNLGRGMDPQDKEEWFRFLQQMKQFAVRHDFNTFTPQNLNKLKHTMAGMAAIKEGLFEGYYGNRKVSYSGEPTEARLMIRHNRQLGETDARYRYVESLFIETTEGERWKLPFRNLSAGRAMLEHVRQGGRPYDVRGVHITEMVSEINTLSRFRRATQGRVVEGVAQNIIEQAQVYLETQRATLKNLGTSRGYRAYFESWTPADISQVESLVEEVKDLFVETTIDSRIEAALPLLTRIQSNMKEADIFENWAERVAEGSWSLPDSPEARKKLETLMSQELPVGPDAANATEQLYDIFGDDDLFDRLQDLADQDPDADARFEIHSRAKELGIELQEPAMSGPTQQDLTRQAALGQQDTEQVEESDDHDDTLDIDEQAMAKGSWSDLDKPHKRDVKNIEKKFQGSNANLYLEPLERTKIVRSVIRDLGLNASAIDTIWTNKLRDGSRTVKFLYRGDADHVPGLLARELGKKGLAKGRDFVVRPGQKTTHPFLENYSSIIVHLPVQPEEQSVAESDDQESKLYNGCYVRDEQDGPRGEVFRMTGDPSERSVRISDRQGRGWYIHSSRLTLVDENDPAVAEWFGGGEDEDEDLQIYRKQQSELDIGEDSTDPMDHRGAVTDSFYEDLARLKSLAFIK